MNESRRMIWVCDRCGGVWKNAHWAAHSAPCDVSHLAEQGFIRRIEVIEAPPPNQRLYAFTDEEAETIDLGLRALSEVLNPVASEDYKHLQRRHDIWAKFREGLEDR